MDKLKNNVLEYNKLYAFWMPDYIKRPLVLDVSYMFVFFALLIECPSYAANHDICFSTKVDEKFYCI